MYSKEQVLEASIKYFNGDELAANVWIDKYALKDSSRNLLELTPDDMHKRLAKEFAKIEAKYKNALSEQEIYELLKDFKYIIPQGSPMAGIGNNYVITSLSNCFVIAPTIDSYGGILRSDQELVQLMKRRGGVGLDLSNIRAIGSLANGMPLGNDTGVPLYMERFSNSTREVAQDGRRGALMLSLDINHPDADKFIDKKMDTTKVTGANISVKIDHDFMRSLDSNNKNEKSDKNKQLWNKIINNAWKSAEPGILFWDTILQESPARGYGEKWKESSTNPCVSYDTLILTDKGYKEIGSLVGSKVNVWNGLEFSEVEPMITGENQPMLKISFSDGSELKCTDYHGFYTWEGYSRDGKVIKKEAKDLKVGDKLEKFKLPILDYRNGEQINIKSNANISTVISKFRNETNDFDNKKGWYTLGFYAGDGTLKRSDEHIIQLYGEKRKLLEHFRFINNPAINEELDRTTICVDLLLNNITGDLKKYVPTYQNCTFQSTLYWLAGIIDSDGSRNSSEGSISISSTDKDFLMKIKLHVLNTLGVNGSVIDEKEGGLKKIKGVEYNTNKSYRLVINASNVKKLYDLGLRTHRVKIDDVNPNRDASRFITVKSIERIENADKVYCFTDPKRGRGCFNGIVTANCGEIPLNPYDSCRLLAINLYSYVVNPFTKDAYFDFELFKQHSIIAQRLMDDLVDLEIEKLDKIISKIESDPEEDDIKSVELNLWKKIKQTAVDGRRTGLGITAEGDMLAALNIKYGTDEAIEFAEEVHKQLALSAYKSSIILAKERGCFKEWNIDKDSESNFVNRIIENIDYGIFETYCKSGRRNIACLTIAPTGTTSLLSQTTSGIEPVFLPFYTRRRKTNDPLKCTFKDEIGDMWEEYFVFHHKFIDWYIIASNCQHCPDVAKELLFTASKEDLEKIYEQSPYYKATSNDVDYIKKVEMQGRIQKWVDHSISVTVNMNKDVTVEDVDRVYKKAWESWCKGVTIYRDGSRSGVLIASSEKKEEKKEESFFHRPEILEAKVMHFMNEGTQWVSFVGVKNNKPFEIFTGPVDMELFPIPKSIQKGKIIKVKTSEFSRYDFQYEDSYGYQNTLGGLSRVFSKEYWNYARLVSGMLRNEVNLPSIVEVVEGMYSESQSLHSWKNGVIRALKSFIKDGESTHEKCKECGSDLVYVSGCKQCNECGWSKCS